MSKKKQDFSYEKISEEKELIDIIEEEIRSDLLWSSMDYSDRRECAIEILMLIRNHDLNKKKTKQ